MKWADVEAATDPAAEMVKANALAWPEKAAALAVVDDATYGLASEMLKGIKALRNRIAETFDKHIKRAHEAHKGLVKEKADAEAPLTQAEATIKRNLVTYSTEQERLRKLKEQRLAEMARQQEEERQLAEAAALESYAVETGDAEMLVTAQEIAAAPVVAPVIVLPKATPVVSGISFRDVWKFRVVNAALVPREYLSVDEVKIGGVVRAMKNTVTIPGVDIYSEKVASASGR